MWKGMWWKANVEWRADLIREGKKGRPLGCSLSVQADVFHERYQPRDSAGWTHSHPDRCPPLISRTMYCLLLNGSSRTFSLMHLYVYSWATLYISGYLVDSGAAYITLLYPCSRPL